MIRKLMRTLFPRLVDILFILSLSAVFVSSIVVGVTVTYRGFSFMSFIGVLVPGTIGVILSFGIVYVILDIRDSILKANSDSAE